jgi:hypothetical protein
LQGLPRIQAKNDTDHEKESEMKSEEIRITVNLKCGHTEIMRVPDNAQAIESVRKVAATKLCHSCFEIESIEDLDELISDAELNDDFSPERKESRAWEALKGGTQEIKV